MINMKEVQAALREMYASSGMTQTEIAQATGVSQSYIADLLSGKSSMENLSLKKINQLFPRAILLLSGDTVSIHANRNSGNVVGVNHGTVSQDCLAAVQNKILEAEALSDEEKVKVLKVLKK